MNSTLTVLFSITALFLMFISCAQPRKEELSGLKGAIEKIEKIEFMEVDSINGKWLLTDKSYLRRTVQWFDREEYMLRDSLIYRHYKILLSAEYKYDKGKNVSAVWRDSTGTVVDKRIIEWKDDYTAVASQLNSANSCLYKMYWFYNKQNVIERYIITGDCNTAEPDKNFETKGTHEYGNNGLLKKSVTYDNPRNGEPVRILKRERKILEVDDKGNPVIVLDTNEHKGKSKSITIYKYTYF
ncbi:MAG: hypothetical protein EOO89_15010, partial [Pedobacter sp.]